MIQFKNNKSASICEICGCLIHGPADVADFRTDEWNQQVLRLVRDEEDVRSIFDMDKFLSLADGEAYFNVLTHHSDAFPKTVREEIQEFESKQEYCTTNL